MYEWFLYDIQFHIGSIISFNFSLLNNNIVWKSVTSSKYDIDGCLYVANSEVKQSSNKKPI